MRHLPLFAALAGSPCLVVGGGVVAERKVRDLQAAGARVTVNSLMLSPALEAEAAAGCIRPVRRAFDASLVADHLLVIAATDDRTVNQAVSMAARTAFRLCNVVDDPVLSTWISPAVIHRPPITVAISSGGHAPVLARLLRQQIEKWLPPGLGALATWAGRWRERVKTHLPEMADRRRLWESVFAGVLQFRPGPAADVLSGRVPRADAALKILLEQKPASGPGIAWLVGAGPGDAELITLRGLHRLQNADVVLHDRLVATALLGYARRDAELIDVGKTGGGPSTVQTAINELLIQHVRAGARVCRLKGGDPFIFGRGSEEALALADAGLPFEIVPGITAASGCAAYAGIPLTHRGLARGVRFMTAHQALPAGAPDDADQTLVVYMGGQRLAEVSARLQAEGHAATTPAAVIIAGTTDAQHCIRGTLASIANIAAASRVGSPAILFVGRVVGLASRLAWFKPASPSPADEPAFSNLLFSGDTQ